MKSIIAISFILLSLIITYGCSDSLGYDPNVQIIQIDKDQDGTDDNPPTPGRFKVDSIELAFKEVYKIRNNKELSFPWRFQPLVSDVWIDTSSVIPKAWIDLELITSGYDDQFYLTKGVADRVLRFSMYFTSELSNQFYRLDDRSKATKWVSLEIKDIPHNRSISINGSQVTSYLIFNDDDRTNGILKLALNVEITEWMHQRGRRFVGNINLHYK